MRPKIFIPIRNDAAFTCLDGIRNAHGTPLWRAFLQTLAEFDVFVDTDSKSVVNAVESDPACRCTVFMRDSKLLGEEITTNDLIASFLDRYWIQHETVIQTHITHPFLRPVTLRTAWESLDVSAFHDSVISVNRETKRIWSSDSNGHFPINHNPMNLRRTAHLPPVYFENSAFYVFAAERFRAVRNRLGLNPHFFEIEAPESISISTTRCWRDLQNVAASLCGWTMDHISTKSATAETLAAESSARGQASNATSSRNV